MRADDVIPANCSTAGGTDWFSRHRVTRRPGRSFGICLLAIVAGGVVRVLCRGPVCGHGQPPEQSTRHREGVLDRDRFGLQHPDDPLRLCHQGLRRSASSDAGSYGRNRSPGATAADRIWRGQVRCGRVMKWIPSHLSRFRCRSCLYRLPLAQRTCSWDGYRHRRDVVTSEPEFAGPRPMLVNIAALASSPSQFPADHTHLHRGGYFASERREQGSSASENT